MPALTEVNLVTAAAIFVVGLLAGALGARLVLPSRRKLRELTSALDEARTDLVSYRANVSEHFEKTSELVATMTASYKAVYDHLAIGARTLCEENAALGAGRFATPRLLLDQDLSLPGGVAATGETTEDSTTSRSDTPTRADAPILEMQREESSSTPATDTAESQALDPADDRNGDAGRSPLH